MKSGWGIMCAAVALAMLAGCAAGSYTSDERTEKVTVDEEVTSLQFPHSLSNGLLIAEEVINYSGAYWEDGSGEEVTNVAGLLVNNPTDKLLEFGAFSVEQAGRRLYFFACRVPPQSRCLILEYEKKSWSSDLVTDCRILKARWGEQELSRENIDYIGVENTLTIINRDKRELSRVLVWYKQYDGERECYLGGGVHSTQLICLMPEEYRAIKPTYYNAAHARVVGIQWTQ